MNLKNEMMVFWRKFALLLDAGVPIRRTLEVIHRETADQRMQTVIGELLGAIQSGVSLTDALAEFPAWFPPSVQVMVQAGELAGTLETSFLKIAEGLDNGAFTMDEQLHAALAQDPATLNLDREGQHAATQRLVDELIRRAVERRASDIHLDWVNRRLRLRYRVDGLLTASGLEIPEAHDEVIVRLLKLMAGIDATHKGAPQSGRMRVELPSGPLELRLAVSPAVMGDSITIRILDRKAELIPLRDYPMSLGNRERVGEWLRRPHGIIACAGPAGSGKTTLLYTMLTELNQPERKIFSLEDPVEYLIPGVVQNQVDPRTGFGFAAALRTALLHDPDVVLVGEIRDLETAHVTIQMAMNGLLVLTSMNTPGAPETVRHLLDIGIEPFLISNAVVGVVAQRLVRCVCPSCARQSLPDAQMMAAMPDLPAGSYRKGEGCTQCHGLGYLGRTAVHELLEMSESLGKLLSRNPGCTEIRQLALESGMQTLRQDGLLRASEGITSLEEVLRVT